MAPHQPRGTQPPQGVQAKPGRGEPGLDRPPPSTPDRATDRGRTCGGARTTWNGPTSDQCRDHARCARHTTQGAGGADAPGARAHTHAKGARGLPEWQPDRARGTHRPRGMAYQRARVRDRRTGRLNSTRWERHVVNLYFNQRSCLEVRPFLFPEAQTRPLKFEAHTLQEDQRKGEDYHNLVPCILFQPVNPEIALVPELLTWSWNHFLET